MPRIRIHYGDVWPERVDDLKEGQSVLVRRKGGPPADAPEPDERVIQIDNRAVSRTHVRVTCEPNGTFRVEDLNSKGGTSILALPDGALRVSTEESTEPEPTLHIRVAERLIDREPAPPAEGEDLAAWALRAAKEWNELTGHRWIVEHVASRAGADASDYFIEIPTGAAHQRYVRLKPHRQGDSSVTSAAPSFLEKVARVCAAAALRRGRKQEAWPCHDPGFIVYSAAMYECHRRVVAVGQLLAVHHKARRPAFPVLITGASGAGKTELARCLHYYARVEGTPGPTPPFQRFDIGAAAASGDENFLHATLKGRDHAPIHERADGLLRRNRGGTVLLDEIGDMPLNLQPVLLEILDVVRKGGTLTTFDGGAPYTPDVQIILATWRDLRKMVDEGTFRRDLYERIVATQIDVPSLSQHREDVVDLLQQPYPTPVLEARAGLPRHCHAALDADAQQYVTEEADWPGNVRTVERFKLEVLIRFWEEPTRGLLNVSECKALLKYAEPDPPSTAGSTLVTCGDPESVEPRNAASAPAGGVRRARDPVGLAEAIAEKTGSGRLSPQHFHHVIKPLLLIDWLEREKASFTGIESVDFVALDCLSSAEREVFLGQCATARRRVPGGGGSNMALHTYLGYQGWSSVRELLNDYIQLRTNTDLSGLFAAHGFESIQMRVS